MPLQVRPRLPRAFRSPRGRLQSAADSIPDHLRPLGALDRVWNRVAGGRLAQRTAPLRLEGRTLFIAVADPSWARHLEGLAAPLLSGLRGALGGKAPARLRFVVRPDRLPSPAPRVAPTAPPGVEPREQALVRDSGVRRPELAAAIARAMARHRQG